MYFRYFSSSSHRFRVINAFQIVEKDRKRKLAAGGATQRGNLTIIEADLGSLFVFGGQSSSSSYRLKSLALLPFAKTVRKWQSALRGAT
jgi:hypothetical protein